MAKKEHYHRAFAAAVLRPTSSLFDQFLRYLVVGGIAFVVDFGCLFTITEALGVHYLLSASIAFMAGLATNYVLSITWVFDTRRSQNGILEFAVFAGIGIIGLGLNALIMWVFTDLMLFHYLQSKIVSTAVVLLWNFLARKLLLFS